MESSTFASGDGDPEDSLGESAGQEGAWDSPPDLMQRSGEPRYDTQELVRLVGVPANILWGWEQKLGIPRPIRMVDGRGGSIPRYSDRDVLAVLWLRDQLRAGAQPVEAAVRLFDAQRASQSGSLQRPWQIVSTDTGASPGPISGAMMPGPHNSGQFPAVPPEPRGATSGPLRSGPTGIPMSGPLGPVIRPNVTSGPLGGGGRMPTNPGLGPNSTGRGATSSPLWQRPQVSATSGPLTQRPQSAPTSGPLWQGQIAAYSGPLGRAGTSAPLSRPLSPAMTYGPASDRLVSPPSGARLTGGFATRPPHSQPVGGTGKLSMLQGALLTAFAAMDAAESRAHLDEAVRECPVDTLCLRLLQPLVIRLAELASSGHLSPGAEYFGYVTVRNRLAAMLDTMPVTNEAPMLLLACAPGEYHEIGPLILAILWRRVGLRSIYLGPDVAADALIAEARARRPISVCLSAATDAGARSIAQIAGAIARLEHPRPIVGFGGAAFVRSPQLQGRVRGGYFLGVDAPTATRHIFRLLDDGPLPHVQ